MPFYYSLWQQPTEIRKRAAEGLKRLARQFVDDGVPARAVSGTLLLATWNIREFDSAKYGDRCVECFYYIAEIINRFDLVAIQEVREDLRALDRVQEILGGWWKYIVTDVTAGTAGNRERMAFMYDWLNAQRGAPAQQAAQQRAGAYQGPAGAASGSPMGGTGGLLPSGNPNSRTSRRGATYPMY